MLKNLIERYIDYFEKRGFGMKQKLLFFRELAYLLGGGIGINEAIKIIAEQGDTASQRYVGSSIAVSVNEGKTLTLALSRLPQYFSSSDIAIIRAGESSGNLVHVLRNLAQEYVFLNTLQNKFISATTYPIVLFVVAIIAILVLFIAILPGIFSIATQFPGVELPMMTRVLMGFSEFLKNNVGSVLIGIGLILFLISILLSSESGKAKAFTMLLSVPGFGKMIRNYYIVKMMRYLRLLYESGMNYVDSLTLLHDIVGTYSYRQVVRSMLSQVQRGEPMYRGMTAYPELIPANAVVLLKVGEETAQLNDTLKNITESYEEDLMASISGISKVIEPVLIVVMGVVITIVALSVFGIITTILGGVQGG